METIRPSGGAVPPSGPGSTQGPAGSQGIRAGARPAGGLPPRVGPHAGPHTDRARDQRDAGARPGSAPLRGPGDILSEGLGRADLPPPLELMAALEAAERHAPVADRAVPGLGRLIDAVIKDERYKLARMMDLDR